ncbi:MAG: GTP-binding protein [Spirochaetaceae bacterium]|nr:GTP-binding protein [Spirochaetaceae bacterium]
MVDMDIITGFLGAGKTSLINKLLAEAYIGEKPVLIENEFGEVSIDDSLIEDKEVQVHTLSSGCICCTLKGDFVQGITKIMEQYAPLRIIIEPTGLADPSDVLSACEEAGKLVPVQVNAFITVVNAKNFMRILNLGIELFIKQISKANFLVLNRTTLLNPDEVTEIIGEIRRLNPNCIIVDHDKQHMDAMSILTLAEDATKVCPICLNRNCENNHHHNHLHDLHHDHAHEIEGLENISSLSFFPKRSFEAKEMTGLFKIFSEGCSGQILRAKGFLKKPEGGYTHLEYVYGEGELLDTAYTGLPKIIVIGVGLDKTSLTRLLEDI